MPDHKLPYLNTEYFSLRRFSSYWHQLDAVLQFDPQRILEIGFGAGFFAYWMKKFGKVIVTADYEELLRPSVAADVRGLPFRANSFDVVACFEVLEHIPFYDVSSALTEFSRIARTAVIVSVPDASRCYPIQISLPKIGKWQHLFEIHAPLPAQVYDGQHYWELGKKGSEWKDLVRKIEASKLDILTNYRPFESPYHRFIVSIPRKCRTANEQH